jgi:putative Mg2+ transporter-C (MgtC) family protein
MAHDAAIAGKGNMTSIQVFLHLVAALGAGAMVGIERSYHGRAAGMRTYALVCLGSTLAIVAAVDPHAWAEGIAAGTSDSGVTRVIQGIVTGIGFLGAGVIVKEGLSVRGLTTAASIWVTSGIGILIGVGLYVPATVATFLTLATLSVFRRIEVHMPAQSYMHCTVRFRADNMMAEDALRALVEEHGLHVSELSYKLHGEPRMFEFRMVLWSANNAGARNLAEALSARPSVAEFRISPSKD